MRNYCFSALALLLCWFSPKTASTQCATADFNATPSAGCASASGCVSFEQSIAGVVFVFTLASTDGGGSLQFLPSGGGVGGSGSMDILSGTDSNFATTETVSIVRKDGQHFKFNSIYIQNNLAKLTTVQGYNGANPMGPAQTVATDDTSTLNFGGINVDKVQLSSTDFFYITFDDFTVCLTGTETYFRDADNDGFGTNNNTVVAVDAPPGYVDQGGDCNDMKKTVYPGAPELCDKINNDCDGQVDEGLPLTTFYHDYDKDGYGNNNATLQACSAPPGYIAVGGDCNDKKNFIHPNAPELADNLDNDCDGLIDEGVGLTTFYQDYDKDGFGNNSTAVQASQPPAGYITTGGDCNDKKNTVYPGAPELCDNLDNDCDGTTDEGFALTTYYHDYDKDGYGNPNAMVQACIKPNGYITVAGDCNDKKSTINPGATEVVNGVDDDCDGLVDEGPRPVTSVPDEAVEEAMTLARIKVSAMPNPSSSHFTLSIQSKNDQLVQVRVSNILGSLVEQRLNIAPRTTLQIGQSYRPGTYFVEVRQGTERQIIKLMKGSQ